MWNSEIALTCVYMRMCTRTPTCVYAYVYVCACVCVRVCVFACVCICLSELILVVERLCTVKPKRERTTHDADVLRDVTLRSDGGRLDEAVALDDRVVTELHRHVRRLPEDDNIDM